MFEVAAAQVVLQLKAQVEKWAEKVRALAKMETVPGSALDAKKRDLMARAAAIMDKVKAIWPGFEVGVNLAGLGVPALAAAAVVAAAAALITYWIYDFDKFEIEWQRERQEEFRRLEAEVGPERAAEIMSQVAAGRDSGGFFDSVTSGAGSVLGSVIGWGVVLFGLWAMAGARKR